jgi:hypothetical protein
MQQFGASTFGFSVVVHPREPDTAWFVPEIKDEKRISFQRSYADSRRIRVAA